MHALVTLIRKLRYAYVSSMYDTNSTWGSLFQLRTYDNDMDFKPCIISSMHDTNSTCLSFYRAHTCVNDMKSNCVQISSMYDINCTRLSFYQVRVYDNDMIYHTNPRAVSLWYAALTKFRTHVIRDKRAQMIRYRKILRHKLHTMRL
jgi:hypothetical protein